MELVLLGASLCFLNRNRLLIVCLVSSKHNLLKSWTTNELQRRKQVAVMNTNSQRTSDEIQPPYCKAAINNCNI